MATTRYLRFAGTWDPRPARPPLDLADPLDAYAPFAYASPGEALRDCATELSRRWALVAEGALSPEEASLGHFVVECQVHPDGRIEGGVLVLSFPAGGHAEGTEPGAEWDVSMSREDVHRLTLGADGDGWVATC